MNYESTRMKGADGRCLSKDAALAAVTFAEEPCRFMQVSES